MDEVLPAGMAGAKSQSHQIEIRRRKVRRMLARGAGPSEIAAQLDWSRSTINRDIDAIREEIREDLTKLQEGKVEEFLQHLVANYETINEELWTKYSQTDHENIELGALKTLIQLQSEKVDVLQKMGILERVAEMLEVDVTGTGEFNFNIMQVDLEDHENLEELMGGRSLDDLDL